MDKKNDEFIFYPDQWFTPNTYNRNFKTPPEESGVYLITSTTFLETECNYEILYVGSSKNLFLRYKNHEVLRFLKKEYDYIQFYFKEVDNFLKIEKGLIKKIQPLYNTQWR